MDKNQIGMGLAGCLLTASTIATLFKLGILTQKHIDQIIADSHAMLENPDFPDCDPEILRAAEDCLQSAKQSLHLP
jgi:hypothetical protein